METQRSKKRRAAFNFLSPRQRWARHGATKALGSGWSSGLIVRLALLALLAQTIHAHASTDRLTDTLDLEVASGPMASALIEIGRRYSVIISFQPSLVEGQRAMPLRGRYTLSQALEAALRSSDLAADIAPEGIVTLQRVAQAEAPAAAPEAPHEAAATADAQVPDHQEASTSPPVELQRVVIQAKADLGFDKPENGFTISDSDMATLHDMPLSQVPQAVSVLTQDMLTTSQAHTQLEALDYATGVSSSSGIWAFAPSMKIRGFPAQFSLSGLGSFRSALPVESATIERIEVLKGPSGVVGGVAGEDGRGGVVNIVRKQPYPGQRSEATLQVDSQDGGTVRSVADLGGGSDALWRLVAYGSRSRESEAGYAPRHNTGVLGSLAYRGKEFAATLSLQHERRRDVLPKNVRTRSPDGAEGPLDVEITPEEPALVNRQDGDHSRLNDAEMDVQWRLSDSWRVRAKARWERATVDSTRYDYYADAAYLAMGRWVDEARSKSWRWSLLGDLSTGFVKHKLLVATDMQTLRLTQRFASAAWDVDRETFVPGQTPLPSTPTYGDVELLDAQPNRTSERGILVQDQLRIGDLTVRLAMRRAQYHDDRYVDSERNLSGRNWDAGAAYRVLPTMTVYAGAQAAIEASLYAGQTFDGLPIPPGRSTQQQLGTKFDLLDGNMAFTIEAYRLRQRNVLHFLAQDDGDVPLFMAGKASTGIEMELAGRASAALDLSLGVNVMRARDRQSVTFDSQPYWETALAVPQRSMHLLASYRLPESLASGTSVGIGLRAQSASWAAVSDPDAVTPSLRIPGGARLDLSMIRRGQHWSFGAAVRNVFDRRLYEPTIDTELVPLQRGRSVGVTLGYRS